MFKLVTLGLLAALAVKYAQTSSSGFTISACLIGGSLEGSETALPADAYIFYQYAFTCTGKIASWLVTVSKPGRVYLAVWRPEGSTNTTRLVGKNRLDFEIEGTHEYVVNLANRISVEPGDVIGIYHEADSDSGVISLSTEPVYSPQSQLLPYRNADNLKIYDLENKWKNAAVEVAVKASVVTSAQYLKLIKGENEREGVAMVKKDDTWGSICDKWFDPLGWPYLFCRELGYPITDIAVKAVKMGIRLPDSVPVHSHSPKCKSTQNLTMFSCTEVRHGECSHEHDVFIRCKPRVSLTRGKKGVASIYDHDVWGTICDNTPPEIHMEAPEKSWTHAFCLELGYKKMVDVAWAKDKEDNYTPNSPVSFNNPECSLENPRNIDQCPSTSYCGHDYDYYIECAN